MYITCTYLGRKCFQNQINVEVLIRHVVVIFLYLLHEKAVFVAGFSEINKRGGSNKACSWEIFLKKNKKNSMLIRDFRVVEADIFIP